jgi:hypothetical protein
MAAKEAVSNAKVEAAGFSDKLREEKKAYSALQQQAKALKGQIDQAEK